MECCILGSFGLRPVYVDDTIGQQLAVCRNTQKFVRILPRQAHPDRVCYVAVGFGRVHRLLMAGA